MNVIQIIGMLVVDKNHDKRWGRLGERLEERLRGGWGRLGEGGGEAGGGWGRVGERRGERLGRLGTRIIEQHSNLVPRPFQELGMRLENHFGSDIVSFSDPQTYCVYCMMVWE